MSRLTVQVLFLLLALGWGAYVAIELFANTFGDCADAACEDYRTATRGLVFWRGLSVMLLLIIAYRFLRKDPDV